MHLQRYVRGSGNISCTSASRTSAIFRISFLVSFHRLGFDLNQRLGWRVTRKQVCVCVRFMREMFCIRLQTHAEACTLMRKTRGFRVQIINFCLSNFLLLRFSCLSAATYYYVLRFGV